MNISVARAITKAALLEQAPTSSSALIIFLTRATGRSRSISKLSQYVLSRQWLCVIGQNMTETWSGHDGCFSGAPLRSVIQGILGYYCGDIRCRRGRIKRFTFSLICWERASVKFMVCMDFEASVWAYWADSIPNKWGYYSHTWDRIDYLHGSDTAPTYSWGGAIGVLL